MANLLNGLWQGAALTAIAWVLLKLMPRANAATRYVAWWVTLLAVMLLPARGLFHESSAHIDASSRTALIDAISKPFAAQSNPTMTAITGQSLAAPEAPPDQRERRAAGGSWLPIRLAAKQVSITVAAVWILLSLILALRLAIDFRSLRRFKLHAEAATESDIARFNGLTSSASPGRSSRLLVSDEVAAPIALGLFDPAILIPRSLPHRLSESEFDHVILHELAHLRRYDDWMNLLQKLIEALLPIQPAIFWISRQLTLERETACDDWVIAATGAAKPYAASLARVAELTMWARSGILASGAAGNPSQLYRRVQRLLDKSRNVGTRISRVRMGMAVAVLAVLVMFSTRVPQVIAFAEPAAAPAAVGEKTTMPSADVAEQAMPATPSAEIQFSVQPGEELAMDVDRGNVHLKTGSDNAATISVVHRGADVDEFLKKHQIFVSHVGHEVRLRTKSNAPLPSRVEIDYQVTLPKKFDAKVNVGAGNVDLTGLQGKLQTKTGAGNMDLNKLDGGIEGSCGAGNFAATDCAGTLHGSSGTGNIDVIGFAGTELRVHTGTGNASAELTQQPKSDCEVRTGTGNVVAKLGADFKLNLKASTGMGNFSSQLAMPVNRSMMGGAINGPLNGGGPELKVSTGTGNVDILKR